MARYNTVSVSSSISGATTISSPAQGLFTEFTGTAPYTVVLPNPTLFYGETQRFYNATAGVITLSTPSGVVGGGYGSGLSTHTLNTLSVIELASDGTNYIVIGQTGSKLIATNVTITGVISASTGTNNQTFATTSTGVISISSGTTGAINNMAIGGTTAVAGSFTQLSASTAPTTDNHVPNKSYVDATTRFYAFFVGAH